MLVYAPFDAESDSAAQTAPHLLLLAWLPAWDPWAVQARPGRPRARVAWSERVERSREGTKRDLGRRRRAARPRAVTVGLKCPMESHNLVVSNILLNKWKNPERIRLVNPGST